MEEKRAGGGHFLLLALTIPESEMHFCKWQTVP
jgi:hypothetical protein